MISVRVKRVKGHLSIFISIYKLSFLNLFRESFRPLSHPLPTTTVALCPSLAFVLAIGHGAMVCIEGHILKRKQCSIPILGKPQSRHGVHQPRIKNLEKRQRNVTFKAGDPGENGENHTNVYKRIQTRTFNSTTSLCIGSHGM